MPSRKRKSSSTRSRKWHATIKARYGKKFYDKLERCVREVKSKSGIISPYAICFASLEGTTKHHTKARKSRSHRSRQ